MALAAVTWDIHKKYIWGETGGHGCLFKLMGIKATKKEGKEQTEGKQAASLQGYRIESDSRSEEMCSLNLGPLFNIRRSYISYTLSAPRNGRNTGRDTAHLFLSHYSRVARLTPRWPQNLVASQPDTRIVLGKLFDMRNFA